MLCNIRPHIKHIKAIVRYHYTLRMFKIQNVDNIKCWMWSHGNSHSLLVGMQDGTVTLEDSMTVSYKTKHVLTIQSSNHSPRYSPKGAEKLCPHKNLYTDVYSRFILNCQNLEATKMSFYRSMDKLWCIQTMEYYCSGLKTSELSSHEQTWRNLKCPLLSERSQFERLYTVWVLLHDILAKLWSFSGSKKISGCRGGGGGRDAQAEHVAFLGQ